MSDRNETIIKLAQEILGAERNTASLSPQGIAALASQKMIPVKTACLTAIAAALGATSLACFIQEATRPASRYEKVEIEALLFYTAQEKQVPQDLLKSEMKERQIFKDVECMSAYDYRKARDYLWNKLGK